MAGAPNKPNGSVTNWCNPNGEAVFSLIVAIRGSASTLSLNPASNKSVPHLSDQATRQRRGIGTRVEFRHGIHLPVIDTEPDRAVRFRN